jgi:hypothetical protein
MVVPSLNTQNLEPAFNRLTGPQRSNLYLMVPNGQKDLSGRPNGPANYLDYFELSRSGTLTFATAGGSSAAPPPPIILGITRSSPLTTISFTTTKGATYSLFYTNSAGLNSPTTNWPSLPGTITCTGSDTNFQDADFGSNRFYRIGAH